MTSLGNDLVGDCRIVLTEVRREERTFRRIYLYQVGSAASCVRMYVCVDIQMCTKYTPMRAFAIYDILCIYTPNAEPVIPAFRIICRAKMP